jgi:hypothetical protein
MCYNFLEFEELEMRSQAVKGRTTANVSDQVSGEPPDRFYQPTPREAALLVLHVLRTKESETGKDVTRARLTEITLRRLWGRTRISDELVLEVQEYLLNAGWVLFWAGSSYAVIQVSSVEGWPRISSKRINEDLDKVSTGKFDFELLEPLLISGSQHAEQDADE